MLTDDFDLYYDFKFLEGVIFSAIASTDLSSLFTKIDELKQLEQLIVDNRYMFDCHATNNISIIMQELRYIEDEHTIERGEIINNIINAINSGYEIEDNYDFYRYEMCVRNNTNKYRHLKKNIVDKYKYLIDTSIALDSAVLHSHTIDVNSFDKYYKNLVDNPIYIMSIRAIINEYPLILNDERFISRMNKVLSNSKENKKIKLLRKDIKKIKSKF